MVYVGIDLGGTNISVGVVTKNYKIISSCSCKTKAPRSKYEIGNDMVRMVKRALQIAKLNISDVPYVGIGCPGTVNPKTGVVEYSANLFIHNWKIINQMQSLLKKRVVVENDANAAAYGEYLAGAARGFSSSVMITLGTGVGGGIIIDGKIYGGLNYAGAEIGHMVIKHQGRECACSRRGCFETYASATGLIRTTKEFMKRYGPQKTILWSLVDNDIAKVSGRTAFQAAKQDDRVGKMVVHLYISQLACGVTNIVNIFQPDVLCIGGGLSKEDDEFLLEPLKKMVQQERYSKHSIKQTKIVKAQLGNSAGIIGAAMLQARGKV